ncbi:MAG TPA: prolipoprotein diacylglyceryl transferase [bacterium]|nr:prolipoprotein diacylglyceryl transferase [bacterium]
MLVELGPLTVRWYGVMMGLALFLSIPITAHFAARFGLDRAVIDAIAVPFLAALVLGARAGYVLSHLSEFAGRPLAVILPPYAGLSSHGSIAAGLLFLAWWCPRHRVPVWRLLDAAAPAMLVAIILVRWGNFMNGELFGAPTSLPWGIAVPGVPGGPRHPLPLYEIAGTLAILAGVLVLARRQEAARTGGRPEVLRQTGRPFDGGVWWSAVIASSVLRVLLDLLRPEDRTPLFLTLGQIAALVLLAWGLWFLWTASRRAGSRPAGSNTLVSTSSTQREVRP